MTMNLEFTMDDTDFTTENDFEYLANKQGPYEMNTQQPWGLNDTPQKSESTSSPASCGLAFYSGKWCTCY